MRLDAQDGCEACAPESLERHTHRAQIAQMIEHAKAQVARESVKRSVEDALGEAADAEDPKARDDP